MPELKVHMKYTEFLKCRERRYRHRADVISVSLGILSYLRPCSRSQASEDLGTQLTTNFGVWDGAAIVVPGSALRAALAGRHPSLVINCLAMELRWL